MSPPPDPVVDVLGPPWLAETLPLADDEEGEVVATLVHRAAPEPTGRAVLHVHGYADYFFQTGYAEWWLEHGYDFYALDLRKYGRSLRPHQTPNYVADLATYDEEVDEAWRRITERDGHEAVVVSAHSTGGLTMSLWADRTRPPALVGVVLNSPWLELPGNALRRLLSGPVLGGLGRRKPHHQVVGPVTGWYARSLHRAHGGEWDFDLAWKPVASFPKHAGWLRAIRVGHARLHRGLDVPAPVLVLSSDRSTVAHGPGEELDRTDVVLEVPQIRRWAVALGPHVTYVAVPGARHDVVLSRSDARARVYDVLGRWHDAFVGTPSRDHA